MTPDKAIKLLREDIFLSQRQLAKAVGITPATLSNIEAGRHQIAWPTYVKLRRYFGPELDEIIFKE